MENWHPTVVYLIAAERHREDVARGESARLVAAATRSPSVRIQLASALVALARRLDPVPLAAPATAPDFPPRAIA